MLAHKLLEFCREPINLIPRLILILQKGLDNAIFVFEEVYLIFYVFLSLLLEAIKLRGMNLF